MSFGGGHAGRSGHRPERVADLIKEEIASMVLHGEIKDPRIGFVTVTHVKMTPDLKEAKVYFSQIGDDKDKAASLEGFRNAAGYIRRHLAGRLNLKHIPAVTFAFDDSIEYGERMEKVFREMKKEGGQ